MKFKVGQKWRTRDNQVATITKVDDPDYTSYIMEASIQGEPHIRYIDEGRYWHPEDGGIHPLDLVSLLEDVPSEELDSMNSSEALETLKEFEKYAEENPVPEESTAKRFNSGKPDLSLLYPEALRQEAFVWMDGEKKYGRNNWEKLWGSDTINLTCACALRHIMYMLEGEMMDQESGRPHAAHVRANMTMVIKWLKDEGLLDKKE